MCQSHYRFVQVAAMHGGISPIIGISTGVPKRIAIAVTRKKDYFQIPILTHVWGILISNDSNWVCTQSIQTCI